MGSIYDFGGTPQIPQTTLPEPVKRSRKREQLSSSEKRAATGRLMDMVERAFQALEEAMTQGDHSTAVKAAQIVLDRSGFGPKSTVDINQTTLDLSELTVEQLAARAQRIAARLTEKTAKTIDVTPVVKSEIV